MKHAWVTGTGGVYRIHLSYEASEYGFNGLMQLDFYKYRVAQDLANAVKARMRNVKVLQAHRG